MGLTQKFIQERHEGTLVMLILCSVSTLSVWFWGDEYKKTGEQYGQVIIQSNREKQT
jgi:hypothetical protein